MFSILFIESYYTFFGSYKIYPMKEIKGKGTVLNVFAFLNCVFMVFIYFTCLSHWQGISLLNELHFMFSKLKI